MTDTTGTPDTPDCGHMLAVSSSGITVIGMHPTDGTTLCAECARALPPQPMTVIFLGSDNESAYTRTALDTDKIPFPAGYKGHTRYFVARDGTPTYVTWRTLDGFVKYIHTGFDVFNSHQFYRGADDN